MKTTNEAMFEFIAIAQQWLIRDKDNADTKLGYALNKMMSRLKKPQKRYHARVDEIQIDCCMADEKGKLLKDERGSFEFTKQGIKERNAKLQELVNAEIDVEPHIATQLPRKENGEIDLTFAEREAFDGFVLVNTPEPQEEAQAEQPSVS